MGRTTVAVMASTMASNPYSRPKEIAPLNTTCELCDRTMPTKDWPSHKNSKKHRQAELAEKASSDNKAGINTFGADAAGFTPDNGGETPSNAAAGGDAWGSTGNGDSWNISGGFTTTSSSGYGGGNNTRGGADDRACFNCNEPGHQKRDCPKGSSGGGQGCFNCGEEGHRKTDCPNPRKPYGSGGGSDRACYNCGTPGHNKSDCTEPLKSGGGGGGGRECFNCGLTGHNKAECPEPLKAGGGGGGRECHNCKQLGHISRECPEPKVFRCRNCDSVEHKAIDCTEPKDWSRVQCNNCKEYGHTVKRCKAPMVEVDGGEWGNNGRKSGDTAGGWAAGTDAPDVAPAGGNWADEATAVAEGGVHTWGGDAASSGW